MTVSSLCTYVNITRQHSDGRSGQRVCKITPHYMVAQWTGRFCADYFAATDRQASSNYCIGIDGDIAMSVDEDDRAWTSGSGWNDRKAITIECANNPDSSFTTATWNSLVNLCVDICQRYGFRLEYDGTQNGSLTEHRMFQSTDCPGEWMHAHMARLAEEVNAILEGEDMNAGDNWTYHWVNPEGEETAVGGNVYNALMLSANNAMEANVKCDAIIAAMGADSKSIATAVEKAVKERLESFTLSITDTKG